MFKKALIALSLCTAISPVLFAAPLYAEIPGAVTENGFISGSMNIDFGTRKNLDVSGKLSEGSPAEGATDSHGDPGCRWKLPCCVARW